MFAETQGQDGLQSRDSDPARDQFQPSSSRGASIEDMPAKGPGLSDNVNFVITELDLFVGNPADAASFKPVKVKKAVTDFDQTSFSAAALIDNKNNDQGGWAVYGATGTEHWAVLELDAPVELKQGEVLQWVVHQQHNAKDHRLGRFRLSIAKAEGDLQLGLSETLAAIATIPVDSGLRNSPKMRWVTSKFHHQN